MSERRLASALTAERRRGRGEGEVRASGVAVGTARGNERKGRAGGVGDGKHLSLHQIAHPIIQMNLLIRHIYVIFTFFS